MANDAVLGVTIKAIGDFSDVVSNVGSVQKALTKLKLPDKLGENLNKNLTAFYKEYDKYQKKIAEGIHTQGDQNAVNKSLNSMLNSYEKIVNEFSKLSKQDFKNIFNLDEGAFASVQKRIKDIQTEIKKIKIDPKQLLGPMEEITKLTKAKAVSGGGKGIDKIQAGIKASDFSIMKQGLIELETYYERFSSKMSETKRLAMADEIKKLKAPIEDAINASDRLEQEAKQLDKQFNDIGSGASRELGDVTTALDKTKVGAEGVVAELKKIHEDEFSFNREAQNIDRQIQSYFGLSQMIRKVGDIARDAFATVKELDAAMTQTAVVTNFSVGDMWDMLPTYTQQANQLGSTIKDVYEAATLYYQQGLNTNQAMGLANETLKMARIAGLDAAEATNMMTAALRGFNMEINQASAQKINDIYSELAAITASDTKEIGSAMERTASIANAANMDFATTSAFLAQMIETTREAPENLGTAMKTIVARFQEMKQDPTKLVDSEGVAMDVNKVDKALKTIGVSLTNTKGEFRDLDDVFLDISAKWDSLTQGQQRYIATIAAGSRQQSRFIAMMSDYERTMELVDAANNSAGASQRQFEKTLDSMGAKLNMLKNAWDQFTMGLMNNQILKFGVDALTEGFTIVNKFIDILGKLPPKPFEGITKSVLTLVTTLGMLNFGKKATRGLVTGGAGWWKGETSLVGGFKEGWASSNKTGLFKNKNNTVEAERQGTVDGQAYGRGWSKAVQMLQTKQKTGQGILSQTLGLEQFKKNQAAFGNDNNIINSLFPKGTLDEAARQNARDYLNTLRQELHSGKISKEDLPTMIESGLGSFDGFDNKYIDDVAKGLNDKKIKSIGIGFDGLTAKANSAGVALSNFGMILQGTPLEPFGQILTTVGSGLLSLSTVLATTKAGFLEQWAAATLAATGVETEEITALKAAVANGTLNVSAITTAGGMKVLGTAIWTTLWPLLAIAAAIGAVVLIAKGLDAAIETNKEKLESATDAAAAASEAYDSAKQETSELADAIEQIKSNEEAFDGLVAGTAAFNEQLVTANDQIMDLIKKYPMLNDYLTTDKNGLMHISDEGLAEVKEYQKQRQANASALNLIQTADLNTEEARQKANQMRKTKGTDTLESLAQRKKEADLLEQQAEAQQQMAKLNAVNAALVDKEIGNREKVSSIIADQYDARRDAINLEGESIHDLKQEYADFYGYTYDKSTKKIKDIEGNEIDVSNDAIKDAVKDIRVIADIEVDASSVEGVLHSLDRDFSKTLGDGFKNSSTFISDILSNNAETNEDLLEQVLDNPEQLNDFVEGLSTKEIAAVLGASEKAVENNIDNYKQQLEDKLLTNARNIIDTNAQANGELAAMLAQAQGKTINEVLNSKEIQNNLMQQVKDFTSEQRNTLLNIGKTLETSVGSEAMTTFINGLSDIYQTGNEELITTAQNWADGVNWDSAIGRLEGYNEAINMTADDTNHLGEESVKQINNLGQALLDSRDEANLLGEAFTEFYNSTDFQDMAENMDKFVDSSGQLNAASIMDMAEECGSLNNLLDTGAISAGGVAAALNALGSDGDLVLSDLNSKVLELLSNFGQLDGIIASSHRNIENFDWGIDTGESADFVKESAEKWNELYNNGEVGNPQLEAYAKYVLGEEKYIALLAEHSGDLQATMDDVSKYVNEYSEGFDKAWSSLADGGWEKKVPKELQDLNISFGYDENGKWEWNPGSATTEQLSEWLQAVKGIGPEMAAAMIEDWQNYSGNFRAERQKNDFQAGLDSYIEQRKGANGEIAITASELQTIASSTGQEIEEVRAAIAERAGIEENQIKVLENIDENTGEYVTDGAVLNKELSQTLGANGQNGWLAKYQATDSTGNLMKNTIDIGDAIAGAIERGYTQAQATSMAYESYTNAEQQGKDYYYKGELIEAGQYKSLDDFATRLAEIDQNEQWVTIGQTMADAWIARIDAHENGQTEKPNQPETPTTQSSIPKGTTIPGVGYVTADGKTPRDLTWQDRVPGWVTKLVEIYNNPPEPKSEPTELTPAQYQKMYGGSNSGITEDKSDESNNNLQEAATKLQEGSTQIETAATKLETGATKVESAASKLETAASNLSKPEGLNSKNSTIPNGSTVPGVGFVPSNGQSVNGNISIETSEADAKITALQTKLKELNDLVSQGNTYKLNVSGAKDIKAAASAAKTLTKNTGTQTIKVKTGKADTSSVDAAKKTINSTESKIKVGATVDSAIAAARRAQRTINGMSATIEVEVHVRKTGLNSITVDGKTITVNTAATGKHNHGYAPAPTFGSAARGRYGQVGPKGKGGLTLTGELGYEVAWLPDENRSMILGAKGPQMIDLPGNAVVWDHEQSKKIVKQKAIPAGSHSNSTRPGDIGGSGGSNGGGKGGGKGGDDKSSKPGVDKKVSKEITKLINKTGYVVVWWDNQGHIVSKILRNAEKSQKSFDDLIKKATATVDDIEVKALEVIKDYQSSIKYNTQSLERADQELVAADKGTQAQQNANKAYKKANTKANRTKLKTLEKQKKAAKTDAARKKIQKKIDNNALTKAKKQRNKANKKAVALGTSAEISWEQTKKTKKNGKTKTSKVTKKANINMSKYIMEDPNNPGTYILNEKAIQDVAKSSKKGGVSKAEAIRDAGNKIIDDKTKKKEEAEDNIEKAREAIAKMGQDIYDTFYGWENTLTRIYNITQKIETSEKRAATYKSGQELVEARLTAGFMSLKAAQYEYGTLIAGSVASTVNEIQLGKQAISAQKSQLEKAIDKGANEEFIINRLNKKLLDSGLAEEERALIEAEKQVAQDRLDAIKKAKEYANITTNSDGTINLDIQTDKLEQDRKAGLISETEFGEITKYLENIQTENTNLLDEYQKQTSRITELYQSLADLKQQRADYAKELFDQFVENRKKEIENVKTLSNAISDASKELLDEVKNRLDERRKREDNLRTETDISKKQQRLAALRADTSGGNKVAIAQLEKEIADAQQSYGRTLEDQLLDNLSKQNDIAQKQRERQISLQEKILEQNGLNGTYAEHINWLLENANNSDAMAEIRSLLQAGYDYEGMPQIVKEVADAEIEKKTLDIATYQQQFDNLSIAIGKVTTSANALESALASSATAVAKSQGINTSTPTLTKEEQAKVDRFNQLRDALIINPTSHNYADASYRIQQADAAWKALTPEEQATTQYNIRDTALTNMQNAQKKAEDEKRARQQYETYQQRLSSLKTQLHSTESIYNSTTDRLNKIPTLIRSTSSGAARTALSREQTSLQNKQKELSPKIESLKQDIATLESDISTLRTQYHFKTGGLANFTGPAWLDGTPSKPELVLNAADTKNFIALKDVLSRAVGSTKHIENSYGGNATYEININVDHLNNDYDVDKVVERVKKKIVQDSGYRNVTQVRNFR